MLREQGKTALQASKEIEGKSTAFKNELLFENGINYNDLPSWQKRGIGFYWEEVEKKGWNPITKEEVIVKRKEIKVDFELPMGENYNHFIKAIMKDA
ncbi:hypothetical protein [Flammeovirga aprica]|uniref:hypothetical protein n=1 Tax=Flammeovirga aprica TaxID=29528 RepID=UPI001F0DBCAE|nr:hypothetical protein [Flammeovirga aprica]